MIFALILAVAAVGWLYIIGRILSRISAGEQSIVKLAVCGYILVLIWPFLYGGVLWYFITYAHSWLVFNWHDFIAQKPVSFFIIALGWLYLVIESIRRHIRNTQRRARIRNCLLSTHVDSFTLPHMHYRKRVVSHALRTFATHIPGNSLDTLHIHRYSLTLPQRVMPAKPVRIVHLTDLHLAEYMPEDYFSEVIMHTMALQPDVIVLTGDFTCDDKPLHRIENIMKPLHAPHGVYFVLGNHDIWHAHAGVIPLFEACGFIHIAGKMQRIEFGDTPLYIAGTERPFIKEPETNSILKAIPPDAFSIVLSHHPDSARWIARYSIACVFSGHTHGGQNALPLVGPPFIPSGFGSAHAEGFVLYNNTLLYINHGLAANSLLRMFCPLEIACFNFLPEKQQV